jgi:hypothetical protein
MDLRESAGDNLVLLIWNKSNYVGFEVFTSVTMKNSVFWDVAPSFEGTCRLHLQGRRNNGSEEKCLPAVCSCLNPDPSPLTVG